MKRLIVTLMALLWCSSAFTQTWPINESTVAYWKFDQDNVMNQNVFMDQVDSLQFGPHDVMWQLTPPTFETVNGITGVLASSSYGALYLSGNEAKKPFTVDNPQGAISYGIKVYLYSLPGAHRHMYLMGFYEGFLFSVSRDRDQHDLIRICTLAQTDYLNYPGGWRHACADVKDVLVAEKWHEIVGMLTVDESDRVDVHIWVDGVEYPTDHRGCSSLPFPECFEMGVRTDNLSDFRIGYQWHTGGGQMIDGLVSEAIVQQGFLDVSQPVTATVIDFEDFGASDQGKRFGVDFPLEDGEYGGFDWAYDSINKIDTWGSFTVQDSGATGGNNSNGDSIPGAGGENDYNWLKARAADVGKGAKITNQDGFLFESMRLYTDEDHPAFLDVVRVTYRTVDNVTSSGQIVDLVDDSWIEVTAGYLGIPEDNPPLLKAIWFNGPGITNPNAAKFGLDDFKYKEVAPE